VPVKLVVLSACFSAKWINCFLKVAVAVVAMPFEVYELSARAFSLSLYQNLYAGMSLEDAIQNATVVMRGKGDANTKPVGRVRKPHTTSQLFLFRKPELLAKFEEPLVANKRGTLTAFSVEIYLEDPPFDTKWVRFALDVAHDDEQWKFETVTHSKTGYANVYLTNEDDHVMALVGTSASPLILHGQLSDMLRRYYAFYGGDTQTITSAIETLERGGKRADKSTAAVKPRLPRSVGIHAKKKRPAVKKKKPAAKKKPYVLGRKKFAAKKKAAR
jgi:hypothetical protein